MPELQVGDWILFENMGAYTVAAASTFNGFQRPTIHYVMSRPAWLVTEMCGSNLIHQVLLVQKPQLESVGSSFTQLWCWSPWKT